MPQRISLRYACVGKRERYDTQMMLLREMFFFSYVTTSVVLRVSIEAERVSLS